MLQASWWERPAAGAGSMWVPGMSPAGLMDSGSSARAQEIARRREEMMGMLHDLPESEYELSLTDLVVEKAAPCEGKQEPPGSSSASGRLAVAGQQHHQTQTAATGRAPERRGGSSARRRDSSSFRSSSDGVLLNFYMPRSLTRSFTAPRPSRTTPSSISGGRTRTAASDCDDERESETVKCWSLPWDRPWRKSSRRDPAATPKDSVRFAILKAAKHSAKQQEF